MGWSWQALPNNCVKIDEGIIHYLAKWHSQSKPEIGAIDGLGRYVKLKCLSALGDSIATAISNLFVENMSNARELAATIRWLDKKEKIDVLWALSTTHAAGRPLNDEETTLSNTMTLGQLKLARVAKIERVVAETIFLSPPEEKNELIGGHFSKREGFYEVSDLLQALAQACQTVPTQNKHKYLQQYDS